MSACIEDAAVAAMDIMHSCRCCLRCAPDRDLTTPYTHRGRSEIYSDMLKACFDLDLTMSGDGLCGICSACVARLRDASDFKAQVQRSQAELRVWRQGAARVKEEESMMEPEMEDMDAECNSGEPVSDEEPPFKQEMLDVYGRSDELSEEPSPKPELTDEDETDDEMSPALDGCGGRRLSSRAREQLGMACSVRLERLRGDEAPHASHTSLATSRRGPGLASRMEDAPDDTAGLRAEEQAYTCDTCGEHFTGKSTLIAHVRRHRAQGEPAATSPCGTRSGRLSCENVFAKHIQGHLGKIAYTCDMCSEQFRAKSNLIRHIRTHMIKDRHPRGNYKNMLAKSSDVELYKRRKNIGEKLFRCEKCNQQFTRKGNLDRHKRIHTGEKPYRCGECNKLFTQKVTLDRHKTIHTGEKPYRCGECNKLFTHKVTLDRHKRTHTGEKPYHCGECNNRFTQKGHLDRHKRIHTGEKPYCCGKCNKQFTQKCDLDRHKQIHTGETPYRCGECNKQFTIKNHLNRHRRIHTGEKPYCCGECNKQFTQKGDLNRHKRIHNGEKPYRCGDCNKQFTRKAHLNSHRTIHIEEKSYICEICEVLTSNESDLSEHYRTHMNYKS